MSRINRSILYIVFSISLWSCGNKDSKAPPTQVPIETETSSPSMGNVPVDVNKGRLAWQKPLEVINKLGDLTGKT
ncbi:MAG: hypothetical protein ACI9FN_003127, partial [Saprospiraceae bacterium]